MLKTMKPCVLSRSLFGIVLGLFAALVSACAKREALRPVEPYSGPVTIEVLRSAVGLGTTRTLKAGADVRIYRRGELSGSFSGVLGYKAPSRIRTSFFGPFGLTAMEFLLSDDIVQVSLPPRNLLYEGKSIGISLAAPADGRFRYAIEQGDGIYTLLAFANEGGATPTARYVFDSTYLLNRAIILSSEGLEAARLEFDDFSGRVPQRARISFAKGPAVEIALEEPEFDTEIPDDYFLPIDHGEMRVLPLRDLLRRFDPSR